MNGQHSSFDLQRVLLRELCILLLSPCLKFQLPRTSYHVFLFPSALVRELSVIIFALILNPMTAIARMRRDEILNQTKWLHIKVFIHLYNICNKAGLYWGCIHLDLEDELYSALTVKQHREWQTFPIRQGGRSCRRSLSNTYMRLPLTSCVGTRKDPIVCKFVFRVAFSVVVGWNCEVVILKYFIYQTKFCMESKNTKLNFAWSPRIKMTV